MSALVCFAVPQEARPFQRLVEDRNDVQVLVTGMGAANARRAVAAEIQKREPSHIFTCGFAGALNSELRIGDVVFDSATTPPDLQRKLHSLGAKPVAFFCAKRVATTVLEKETLRARTKADAVEMESEAIRAACREHRIPCTTVRVISDEANENLPLDFNQILRADMTLDFARLVWSVAKSPGKIGELWRLQKNCGCAAEQLARVVTQVIGG